ncbi:putative ATP-dependent helicase C23E6.02 [Psilocybe cubensis]|uniref:Helicase C-terminal domain-containing protein n=2 Tax=Psilocybe cubensis TaxID=181762 RepID=A0A8H7Y637_PSICU|nr:putative ATP-dependent helicase C23E6.02 [Psilocybe cubensis]KAH9484424.1 putative ATP-dependent helicase C23E6.02 [Psilocybe cubensis]
MVLRIYLIPYDLSGVKGVLKIRKDNVLIPARRLMRNLLPRISKDVEKWYGMERVMVDDPLIPHSSDTRTLADIYTDLASPRPIPVKGYGEIASRLLDFSDDLEGLGMRSSLYRYQRRSVAAMLHHEINTDTIPDPLYIPLKTVDNKTFFFQPGTMEVIVERQETDSFRGGILCEELGTGKTVMILSLIVATRNQISSPEPTIIDNRPIMTPLALRHFPSDVFASTRKQISSQKSPAEPTTIPTLVELMLHKARTSPNCTIPTDITSKRSSRLAEKEEEVEILPVGEMLKANVPFYFQHMVEPSNRERTQRRNKDLRPRIMYLTSATLIIVPANLLSQWDREIIKHCDVPLRVLILRAKTPVPIVQSLATDYDIILMSYTRFTTEANNADVSKLHTDTVCTCPEIPGSRVPRCSCQIPNVSPFLQIRWKRLVIDEGHVSSSLSTHLVPFVQLLSVERRWIVTGTPTTNLLGLSLGSKSVEEMDVKISISDVMEKDEDPTPSSTRSSTPHRTDSDEGMLESPSEADTNHSSMSLSESAASPPSSVQVTGSRVWNRYDREDLNKLSNMITYFIAVPQFNADKKLIPTHVIEPLLDPHGPRPGAIQVLNQVMEMVMIRHRIEDVEKDVVLPPVSQESVLLDLDPFVIRSFNALQAIITINAVDSQRTDQDYMFHPRNAEHLQDTVRNMSQICFWHIDENLYNARDLVRDAEIITKRAEDRNMPPSDISALKLAFDHLRNALSDSLWVSMQTHEDVPYRVYNLPQRIFNAWTRTPGQEPGCPPNQNGFMHADRLLKLHDMVVNMPLKSRSEDAIVELGGVTARRDMFIRQQYEESQRRKNKGHKRKRFSDEAPGSGSQLASDFGKKASAADTLKEMQMELDATLERIRMEEENDGDAHGSLPTVPSRENGPHIVSSLVASSPLVKLHIGSSASSKLNFIINEVQRYSPTEKFLIFSESPLSLAHVAESLELIGVKFLRFTTQVNPQFREQLVLTFETSETYRVFLMELKHGARGLNLISASRVIFCEPVWQADVESQAIKRAHRIGQTRPISVKTLAIRGTAEENMVARRTILKDSHEKLPKVIEEAGMRHYIANPKFISRPPVLTPINAFPLIHLPPEFDEPRFPVLTIRLPARPKVSPSLKRVRVEDPIEEETTPSTPGPANMSDDGSPKKKKKTIRFALP